MITEQHGSTEQEAAATASFYQGKRVLVLGGAGFIGSCLVRTLVNYGARVVVVDGLLPDTGGDLVNLAIVHKGLDGCFTEPVENLDGQGGRPLLAELVADADLVIDAMASTSHHVGMTRPQFDLQCNLMSHLCLIEALEGNAVKKVIYLGSRGQYGRVNVERITEKTPRLPIDVQGVGKDAAENLFRIYAPLKNFQVLSLRITNCFGEHQKVSGADIGLVGSFVRDYLDDRTVEIYGSAKRKKNLIYVRDLVNIILRLGSRSFDTFEAYNIAGQAVSLERLLTCIGNCLDTGNYVVRPFPDHIQRLDVGQAAFVDDKLQRRLNNVEVTALDLAIEETVNYFKGKTHAE